MAEPIGPEAYLAIAASVRNAVNNYRDKKRVEENHKLAVISADSSKSSLTLPANELLSYSGLKIGNDGYVQWAVDNPAHPRNWSGKRKAFDLGLILLLEFAMNAMSAGGTPASFYGSGVLGHGMEVGLAGFTTMYLLGQALGALLLSPYFDKSGRRTLYIASAFLYSVFCLPVAATSSIAGVFVGRLIAGAISAIPAITTRRSIEDLFVAESRMWAFFSWALVTNLGLVLGPIYASYVAVSLNWRWIFYFATIIVAVTGMLMYFIRESHASQLLERRVAAIQSHRADLILRTAPIAPRPSIVQPVILTFTKPFVFLSSLTNAFGTALLYLFAVAFPLIYSHYAWNRQKIMLIFLFIALGLFLSTLTRYRDRHTARKYRIAHRRLAPEKGLFGLAIGAPALAVGLWWFAWTIPGAHVKAVSWPASAVPLILLGYGINEHSTGLPRYVLESHRSNYDAASASVAMLVVRALLSAVFPLFTRQLFEDLGNNPAASVLAAIATASCLLPPILIIFGADSRAGSSSGGPHDDDDESGQEAPVETKAKPRKTVRWGDETDSGNDGSETKSENRTASASSGGSEISRTETESEGDSDALSESSRPETKIETGDFVSSEGPEGETESANEDEDEDEDEGSEVSRVDTKRGESDGSEGAEIARAETKSSSVSGGGGAGGKKKEKEETRVDDKDHGAAGFLGMDVERLAVFPYF